MERRRQQASHGSQLGSQQWTHFHREGEAADTASRRPEPTPLLPGVEWRMEVDLGRELHMPREMCRTTRGVLWSTIGRSALLIELTVPWEEWMEEADERKREKYSDLVAECRELGLKKKEEGPTRTDKQVTGGQDHHQHQGQMGHHTSCIKTADVSMGPDGNSLDQADHYIAVAILIPKEQNSKTMRQFRSIAMLNVEGKIFFSVMTRRMT